jgi:hypothetical protein
MAWKQDWITLVSGEKVTVVYDIGDNYPKQTYIRVGSHLIAGIIIGDPKSQGIYLWQEIKGTYQYLGNFVFEEDVDTGSFMLEAFMSMSTSAEDLAERKRLIASAPNN